VHAFSDFSEALDMEVEQQTIMAKPMQQTI